MNQNKFMAWLTLGNALALSAVAIFYSLTGLIAIFSASPVGIAILGGFLEISKLTVAVWLHKYWDKAKTWKKIYLSVAVIVIMGLTSLGIFGYLSNAHSQQASANVESIAQIERTQGEIARQNAIILRAEGKIKKTETIGSGADVNVQLQIDKEQGRIDLSFKRISDSEAGLIRRINPFQTELDLISNVMQALQIAVEAKDIEKAQSIVGTRIDGDYGPNTAKAIQAFRDRKDIRRKELLTKIDNIRTTGTPAIELAKSQVKDSNDLINRLRKKLGTSKIEDLDIIIDVQNKRIKFANIEIDKLTEEKFILESKNRKLEAEVGPIKFIAAFVFNEADQTKLEEAVSWMIVLIVIVFDPLAVALLIASQYTFGYIQEEADLAKKNITESTGSKPKNTPNVPKVKNSETANKDDEIIDQIVKNPDSLEDLEVQNQLDEDPDLLAKLEKRILTTDGENVIIKNETDKGWI